MTKNLVESIFNSKNNLNNFYPSLTGVSNFDLERDHLFYGRIDPDGDAMYLDDSNLKQIYGGSKSTHFAADFVSEAFSALRKNIKKAADRGMLNGNGIIPTNLIAHKAWDHRDLEYSYNQHINKLYTDFVNNYLEIDRRHEKITDQKSFIKEFIRYALTNASYFPITKTGYITSAHCSPFASGLMVEIAKEHHGLPTNTRVLKYAGDPNFVFYTKEVKKFGFMVDKNAPWRLVFNLASGWTGDSSGPKLGAQMFMERFGISFDNVFGFYYRKAHLEELVNTPNLFFSLYNSFYLQYGTYEKLTFHKDTTGNCQRIIAQNVRNNRTAPIDMSGEDQYEYWLKIILKLRFAETKFHHTTQNFNFFVNEMLDNKRLFGPDAALKYINDLTKGISVPNFVKRGSYWGGMTEFEYQQKKKEALEKAINPGHVQYSLTGTKNIK